MPALAGTFFCGKLVYLQSYEEKQIIRWSPGSPADRRGRLWPGQSSAADK